MAVAATARDAAAFEVSNLSIGVGRTVFVVETEADVRTAIMGWLKGADLEVERFDSGDACVAGLGARMPAVVLFALDRGVEAAVELLDRMKARHRALPVVLLSQRENGGFESASLRERIYDFLPKPLSRSRLLTAVYNAIEHHEMSIRLDELEREVTGVGVPGIIGVSEHIKHLNHRIKRLSGTDITVCVRGESGTGKELVAQAIHAHSGRSRGPFIPVNCAAISESLQDSELFGHERGAFTGATSRHVGKFEQAHGGTLFLDEVAELDLSTQSTLLRVLQERRLHRVGGTREIEVDFRLLTASHRDLRVEAEAGRFREDLYYRIVVFELEVPPLRARDGDIYVLTQHFLRTLALRYIGRMPAVSPEAMSILNRYEWPGNVRELRNAVERALVACDAHTIRPQDLPPGIRIAAAGGNGAAWVTPPVNVVSPMPMSPVSPDGIPSVDASEASKTGASFVVTSDMSWSEIERRTVQLAMTDAEGNRSLAARRLGLGRTTLYRKLREYGLL